MQLYYEFCGGKAKHQPSQQGIDRVSITIAAPDEHDGRSLALTPPLSLKPGGSPAFLPRSESANLRADVATRWMGKKFHQSHLSRKSTLHMRGPDMDLLHAAHAGPSAAHDQRPWSLARNQSRMTASKGLLRVGEAVLHAHRGKGKVIGVDNNDERGKPYIISFESGEVHHYSQASALKLQKLAPEPSPRTRAKTKCDAASLVDVAVHLWLRCCFADRLVDRLRRGAVHDRCLLLAPLRGHLNFCDSQCRRAVLAG